MAKKGKKKESSSSASLPKCVCEHPYVCGCGNRPARPSKGHKWDAETQQWGGKGHKQKGASGQTASKSKEAQTTAVGQTTVAQWQKMPTALLETVCKREGRPHPKYKSIGRHRFRVIVQDAKASRRGTDHDLILVPANTVDNEEQAKQEAALLALLHLTPTLPHERKLPEPYKTTWLNALKATKEKQQQKKTTPNNSHNGNNNNNNNNKPTSKSNNNNATTTASGAKSSSNLSMANSFVSRADKRRQDEKRRRERATRIRKHEAIRMANKDHQVFLSARTRQQIETLLRGETVVWENDDNADNESRDEEEEENDDAKAYVVGRLCSEGFTRAQARTAFGQLRARPTEEGEDVWDHVYDECLQWLCIHLDEHQLPEGFDPRGRTLDVVLAPTKKDPTTTTTTTMSPEASALVATYGLTKAEALFVLGNNSEKSLPMEERVWKAFLGASGVQLPTREDESSVDGASNKELVSEELEAMEAIFPPNEYKLDKSTKKGFMTISIKLPTDEEEEEEEEEKDKALWLEIVVQDGLYPAVHPSRVLVRGHWSKLKQRQGTSLHVALLRFLASLPPSEPMMYELFGQAQTLLQEASDGQLNAVSLTTTTTTKSAAKTTTTASPAANTGPKPSAKPTKFLRRPRVRSPFWSLHPSKTPRAEPHPTVAASMKAARDSLPAAKMKEEFLSIMRKAEKGGRVVLVTGATGSGKTTQIPQFILEDAPGAAKIVVAQPRRLAATGVAGRVANERGESKPGTASVGYVVRGDTALCKSTRLVFCTTGVLLRQLQSEGPLDCMTHIIVDEVHERHLDTDVLLGVLKAKLETTPHLKVILMSATLDADRFSAYWGPRTPRVHIPGRTFPVTDYMLEDVLAFTGYVPPKKGKKKRFGGFARPRKSTPWADSEKSDEEEDDMESIATETTVSTTTSSANEVQRDWEELAKRVDESNVDYDMLGQLVKKLVQTKDDDGSILVFLPGAPEINNAINTIQRITRGMSVMLLPLHGSLQPKDQNAIFRTAPRGSTKVVVSTNVAETSITIPDCTVVIDCCREKQSSYDPVNRMPLLLERFAAKASLKQRRGRAGRVREGVCYKLISKGTYAKLPDHGTPEIHRCALDQTLLSLLFLGVEQGSGNFLRTLLDPPSQQALDSAILSLQKLGAVSPRSTEGKIALTPLGMHLAGIPAPPTVGKILVMGSILGCRSAALAMAAGMSVGRSPFLRIENRFQRPEQEETLEDMKRKKVLQERQELFKTVGNSDHALLAAAYLQWDSCEGGGGRRKAFCDELGLSFNGMRDMKQLVRQLDSSLSSAGYLPSAETDRNANSWRTIRACAVAALSPSQIVRVQRPSTKYAETAEGAVEKDGEARELRFYIAANTDDDSQQKSGIYRGYHGVAEERVFVHPSSANFATGSYSCPWLVYHELVRTSKPFLRDATECSAYALLLFGGKLEIQASNGLIVVEGWVRLAANARIGALIGGLRKRIDQLLSKKIENPNFDICGTVEMKLIRSLLVSDGLGY